MTRAATSPAELTLNRLFVLVLAVVLANGCGDTASTGGEPTPTVDGDVIGGGPFPVADLTVRYTNPDADINLTYRVSCQGDTAAVTRDAVDVTGQQACAALAEPKAVKRLVEGPPQGRVCPEIYGGAYQAEISGMIDNENVDTFVDRRDGCAINDWDVVLAGFLPTPAGVGETPLPTQAPVGS